MSVKTYLEEALEGVVYEGLGDWCVPNIHSYSAEKTLFGYQVDAIKNAVKALSIYYKDGVADTSSLYNLCLSEGMSKHSFDISQNGADQSKSRFDRLRKVYPVKSHGGNKIISEQLFFNRMCFWMATASGKTLVLTKMIEIVDYLQAANLIPRKDIMVLLPSEKVQRQLEDEISAYNVGKDRAIRLTSLKKYEEEKNSFLHRLENSIRVYVYRSDLLSSEETTKRIDTFNYDNGGNWYIFMDEAHKGDKDDSIIQDKITVLSRNGFLFNFSATFADAIDFATTCYNFNLEKFIEAKYGKNIYLSNSSYAFSKDNDRFSHKEKQLQVFKSLIIFTLIKKSKKPDYYHNPLMVTLVNEVNTTDSDTDMFFAELGKIANNQIDFELFERAKTELYDEFCANSRFQFGNERLQLSDGVLRDSLRKITVSDILRYVYNSNSHGVIEVLEGEKGKEFALKLSSCDKAFALFRIGDATQYIKEKLADNYLIVKSYEEKHYFDSLNLESGSHFNILIGSRMFYEGWDSNRPNVMNFINIGKGDAKKFVLQSLGRGVRIEPTPNRRQRLSPNDSNKQQLLETLFVFATNKKAVNDILETMDTQRSQERTLSLKQNKPAFDLFIPYYEDKANNIDTENFSGFSISQQAYDRFCKYLSAIDDNLLYLKTSITKQNLQILRQSVCDRRLIFKIDNRFDYTDMERLLTKLIAYLSVNEKQVAGLRVLSDQIVHFQHIKIAKDIFERYESEILSFADSPVQIDVAALAAKLAAGEITLAEFMNATKQAETKKTVDRLMLIKLSQHLYSPLLLSANGNRLEQFKHIIDVESECNFINRLADLCNDKCTHFDVDWMFSKIDQTVDDIAISMPYFSSKDNSYHSFYPDFIFWIKKGKSYKVVLADPKGTEHVEYLSKVDGFERLFCENGRPRVFAFNGYDVHFELKLFCENLSDIPEKYRSYWLSNDNFDWIS